MTPPPVAARAGGFSLVEMAVVLAIVGLLLAGLLLPLGTQIDQRQVAETTRRLEDAREALIGFAIVNGRLPCPARFVSVADNSGGRESFCPAATGTCIGSETTTVQSHGNCSNYLNGYVPAVALGVQPTDAQGLVVDAWGNRIRYAVARNAATGVGTCPAIAPLLTPGFTATANLRNNGVGCAPSNLLICDASQNTNGADPPAGGAPPPTCGTWAAAGDARPVTNQNTIVAVLISPGKNFASVGSGGTDETENADSDGVFVSHEPRPSGAAGGEFDDLLVWIPVGLLYGRLTSAGVLP